MTGLLGWVSFRNSVILGLHTILTINIEVLGSKYRDENVVKIVGDKRNFKGMCSIIKLK